MTIKTRKPSEAHTAKASPKTAKTSKTLSRARKPAADKVAQAKQADIIEAGVAPVSPPAAGQGVQLEGLDRPVSGRGVFAVRTLGTAVSVESAFLEETGNVLRLPAVFPNREYALQQIDELRLLLNQHFDAIELASKGAGQ